MAGHILPPVSAPATHLPAAMVAKAWKAAQDFEAMALNEFLAPMFKTVDLSQSMFGGGAAEQSWQPLLINEMAKGIAAHGGLGIAAPVYAQMLRTMEEKRNP
jgi:Rod binding domain-containing protein